MFNETNDIESNEIKFYEAKPYEVEYCEVRSNQIKPYEIDYIDIKPMGLDLMKLNLMRLIILILNHKRLNIMNLNLMRLNIIRLDQMKLNLVRLIIFIFIEPHEIKFYSIESSKDYYIKNMKDEFNKISDNLVETNVKVIRCIVDYINNGESLKEIPINLEDIREKLIAYNDTLSFGILSKSSYIDLRKMNIFYSVIFDAEYKPLETKSLKSLKNAIVFRYFKIYIRRRTIRRKTVRIHRIKQK